jgi:hypothetical protein
MFANRILRESKNARLDRRFRQSRSAREACVWRRQVLAGAVNWAV